jgi:hypothetical protein
MNNSKYCEVLDVNTYATDHGFSYWSDLSADEKNRAVMTATLDIEQAHQQPRRGNVPWQIGCITLREAAVLQSLFIGRTIGQRDANDSIASLGSSNVNDGVISVGSISNRRMDEAAKMLVRNKIKKSRVLTNQYGRG